MRLFYCYARKKKCEEKKKRKYYIYIKLYFIFYNYSSLAAIFIIHIYLKFSIFKHIFFNHHYFFKVFYVIKIVKYLLILSIRNDIYKSKSLENLFNKECFLHLQNISLLLLAIASNFNAITMIKNSTVWEKFIFFKFINF